MTERIDSVDAALIDVLIVEDDSAHAEAIQRSLEGEGNARIKRVSSLREYREAIRAGLPTVVLADMNLPDGQALEMLSFPPESLSFPVLVMTSYGDEQKAVQAMKAGALDYVVKSSESFDKMPRIVERALREWRLIKERQRADAERFEMERRLLQSQKLESLGVMAGGIAHDFNNLLTAILGHADLALLTLPPGAPARANMQEIVKASRRAADLCQQLLAYTGKGKFVIQPVGLDELIVEMDQMLRTCVSKKVHLNLGLHRNLPKIDGDPNQLRQVIINLVMNASEAIGEESGVVTISTGVEPCDRDHLRDTHLDDGLKEGLYVTLEVRDTGCGMDQVTRERVFEPFFSTKFTGRGLGMAAVLGILRSHGGAIKVSSELGAGTVFKLYFPVSVKEDVIIPLGAPQEEEAWQGEGTVLLVDDEQQVLDVAGRMLQILGFTVKTARDGIEALEAYGGPKGEIVCVLLDLTMPRMSGEEAFEVLRRLDRDLPIIISSGYSENDVAARFADREVSGFIQKPYRFSELRRVLRRVVAPAGEGS
jgi:signal transduction histidine kinase